MRIEIDDAKKEKISLNIKTAIKTRFTPFQNRGFAYSSAPGNDKLVTDTLGNRLKEAMAAKFFNGMTLDADFNSSQPEKNTLNNSSHSRTTRPL